MSERLERGRTWVQNPLGVDRVDLQPASAYVAVTALLERAGVHVPAIHARDLASGFLLLEDLGVRSYLNELDADSADALYCDALDTLLRMQIRVPVDSLAEYDSELVMQELSLFDEWFLGRHLGIDTTGTARDVLSQSYRILAERFDALADVFVHRDYHSRNLMRTSERNPGVLDFQDAVSGPAVYDVISLLRDVYIEWPEDRVEAWLLDYHREALSQGVPVGSDPREFLRDADLVGAQRHLKIAGIFSRLCYRDSKLDYLRDIPLTLRYLSAECARLPELAFLGSLLADLDVAAKLDESNARRLADAGERNS